jgi:hypothetical protein
MTRLQFSFRVTAVSELDFRQLETFSWQKNLQMTMSEGQIFIHSAGKIRQRQ